VKSNSRRGGGGPSLGVITSSNDHLIHPTTPESEMYVFDFQEPESPDSTLLNLSASIRKTGLEMFEPGGKIPDGDLPDPVMMTSGEDPLHMKKLVYNIGILLFLRYMTSYLYLVCIKWQEIVLPGLTTTLDVKKFLGKYKLPGNTEKVLGRKFYSADFQQSVNGTLECYLLNTLPTYCQPAGCVLHKCFSCNKEDGMLQTCSRCLNSLYCGRDCQLANLKTHASFCSSSAKKI
jgi:hypothetical protein